MGEENFIRVLGFLLNGERFGLKVSDILEVNRLPTILPVHSRDESVIGFINLHGKSVLLLALDRLLMLKSEDVQKEYFIALKTKEGPLCFIVDRLIGFEEISEEEIQKLDEMNFEFDARYLDFVYFKSDSMVSVLDVNFLTKSKMRNDGSVSSYTKARET
ncbi:MAG: chemotaxis protein CheW [Thermodesulfobacteriota bacterium]|nr:chemotaxis protein CheW [Thermodesulfobacteriota bacterium]